MSKNNVVLSFEDSDVLVESKQLKGVDVIRLQPIGTKKEHMLKFDVSFIILILTGIELTLF